MVEPTEALLLAAVKALHAHGLGVKKIVAELTAQNPTWTVDGKRVRASLALQQLGEAHAHSASQRPLPVASQPTPKVSMARTTSRHGSHAAPGAISNAGPTVITLPIFLETPCNGGGSRWVFDDIDMEDDLAVLTGLRMRHSHDLGRYLVAARPYRKGEILFDEVPLIDAENQVALRREGKPWAEPSLRAFCAADAFVQKAVLRMQGELTKSDDSPDDPVVADVASQIAHCRDKKWRRGMQDETLTAALMACESRPLVALLLEPKTIASSSLRIRCCSTLSCLCAVNLNAYPFGSSGTRHALLALGSKFAHSCDSNAQYSYDRPLNVARFTAKRDIAEGEIVTISYLGGHFSGHDCLSLMSTPARREALLSQGNTFVCMCPRCADLGEDTARSVPCPKCHPRHDGLLPDSIAFARDDADSPCTPGSQRQRPSGSVVVHHVSPCRSAVGADAAHFWRCSACQSSFGDAEVMPRNDGSGGLSGRAWERQVEQSVLGVEHMCSESSSDPYVLAQIESLHDLIARSLGPRHWTVRSLRAMMQ